MCSFVKLNNWLDTNNEFNASASRVTIKRSRFIFLFRLDGLLHEVMHQLLSPDTYTSLSSLDKQREHAKKRGINSCKKIFFVQLFAVTLIWNKVQNQLTRSSSCIQKSKNGNFNGNKNSHNSEYNFANIIIQQFKIFYSPILPRDTDSYFSIIFTVAHNTQLVPLYVADRQYVNMYMYFRAYPYRRDQSFRSMPVTWLVEFVTCSFKTCSRVTLS